MSIMKLLSMRQMEWLQNNLNIKPKQQINNNPDMNKPQVKIDSIEVNIKAPGELHVVRPHSAKKQKPSSQHQLPQSIPEQPSTKQTQNQHKSAHKIKHLSSLQDKGQFLDENQHKRLSNNEQPVETITRTIYPEQELPLQLTELEKIAEEGANEEENTKPLKHIDMQHLYDKDQFNLGNSREKHTKKRRLSEPNLENYSQANTHFHVVNYLTELQKIIPEKIVEQESILQKKQSLLNSPAKRHRKNSLHSSHTSGVSQQIQRMIVDEIDKKKKVKNDEEKEQQCEQNQMESIKQEKQQDELVNTMNLQQAREKIEGEINALSKVVGKEIGPEETQHLFLQKNSTIQEQP